MTYLVSPEMELVINDKPYQLSPTVECLKKIQHAMKMDIIDVIDGQGGKFNVKFEDYARIIHIAIEDGGLTPPKLPEIEKWIHEEVGITAIRNIMQSWLLVVTQPKKDREAMQKQVGEYLKALGLTGFLGGSTKNSV